MSLPNFDSRSNMSHVNGLQYSIQQLLHAIYIQVVGRKYIKLYSEDQTEFLYPHEGLLTNTSQVCCLLWSKCMNFVNYYINV